MNAINIPTAVTSVPRSNRSERTSKTGSILRTCGAVVLAAFNAMACAHSNPVKGNDVIRDADCQACFDNIIRRCRQDCGVCGLGQFNWCPVGDNDCLDAKYKNQYGCLICVECTKAAEKACFYSKVDTGKLCEY